MTTTIASTRSYPLGTHQQNTDLGRVEPFGRNRLGTGAKTAPPMGSQPPAAAPIPASPAVPQHALDLVSRARTQAPNHPFLAGLPSSPNPATRPPSPPARANPSYFHPLMQRAILRASLASRVAAQRRTPRPSRLATLANPSQPSAARVQ